MPEHSRQHAACFAASLFAGLNPVEHIWDEVREKYFGNLVFDSPDALEDHLETALRSMELDQPRVKSIVAWSWMVNSNCKCTGEGLVKKLSGSLVV